MRIEQGKRYLLEDGTVTKPMPQRHVYLLDGTESTYYYGKRILCPLDEWVEHDGGPCPVPNNVTFAVQWFGGGDSRICMGASSLDWEHRAEESDCNIVAYRVPSSQFAEQGERAPIPAGCIPLEQVIAEAESTPEGKALMDEARRDVKAALAAMPTEPAEPAVSDAAFAAYEAYYGREQCTCEGKSRSFEKAGLVLRTRQEWDSLRAAARRKTNPPPYPPDLAARDAEIAALREELEQERGYKQAWKGLYETAGRQCDEALAKLERLREEKKDGNCGDYRGFDRPGGVGGMFCGGVGNPDLGKVTHIVNDLPDFGKIPSPKGGSFPPSHRYRRLP